jgi:rubrerythrin
MADNYKSLRSSLAISIEMENRGFSFYKDSAKNTADEITKSVFEFLANEELKHIEAINMFYKSEIAAAALDFDKLITSSTSKSIDKKIMRLFKELGKKTSVDKSDIEIYRSACNLEKNSERFYRKAAAQATKSDIKKLFKFLIKEEMRHFHMLDDFRAFLVNLEKWSIRLDKWR